MYTLQAHIVFTVLKIPFERECVLSVQQQVCDNHYFWSSITQSWFFQFLVMLLVRFSWFYFFYLFFFFISISPFTLFIYLFILFTSLIEIIHRLASGKCSRTLYDTLSPLPPKSGEEWISIEEQNRVKSENSLPSLTGLY